METKPELSAENFDANKITLISADYRKATIMAQIEAAAKEGKFRIDVKSAYDKYDVEIIKFLKEKGFSIKEFDEAFIVVWGGVLSSQEAYDLDYQPDENHYVKETKPLVYKNTPARNDGSIIKLPVKEKDKFHYVKYEHHPYFDYKVFD